jgi:hypothetical protein
MLVHAGFRSAFSAAAAGPAAQALSLPRDGVARAGENSSVESELKVPAA